MKNTNKKKPQAPGPTGNFKQDITNVLLILDRSGSMGSYWTEAVNYAVSVVENLKQKARDLKLETRLTVVTFNNTATTHITDYDVRSVEPHSLLAGMFPTGGTNLWATVRSHVRSFQDRVSPRLSYSDNSFLVIIVTDGEDTYGNRFGDAALAAAPNWTFTAACPPGQRRELINRGFDPDNVVEWEGSRQGMEKLTNVSAQAVTNYMGLRSSGITKSYAFYADASGIGTKELRDLTRVAKRPVEVKSEALTREFAEDYTGQPYRLGSLYYRLDKPEKVQALKDIMLWHKKDKALFASSAKVNVRDILGLASEGEIKVIPGNHGDFEIYVQSTSPVRKLPSHTKVVIL